MFKLPINILRVIGEIAEGLQQLHSHNVIHRDIAARNILVSYDGHAVVADFGLSRSIDPSPDEGIELGVEMKETYYRVDQQHLLPIRWMAPESLKFGKFSRRSDVWMFGVTLYEILTSAESKPYRRLKHANEVIITVCTGQGARMLLEELVNIPSPLQGLVELIEKCLQVEPSNRPTMGECIEIIHHMKEAIRSQAQSGAALSPNTALYRISKEFHKQHSDSPTTLAGRSNKMAADPSSDDRISSTAAKAVARRAGMMRHLKVNETDTKTPDRGTGKASGSLPGTRKKNNFIDYDNLDLSYS